MQKQNKVTLGNRPLNKNLSLIWNEASSFLRRNIRIKRPSFWSISLRHYPKKNKSSIQFNISYRRNIWEYICIQKACTHHHYCICIQLNFKDRCGLRPDIRESTSHTSKELDVNYGNITLGWVPSCWFKLLL